MWHDSGRGGSNSSSRSTHDNSRSRGLVVLVVEVVVYRHEQDGEANDEYIVNIESMMLKKRKKTIAMGTLTTVTA